MQNSMATWFIVLGVVLVVIGIVAKTGVMSWFGELPGDFHIKREGFQFYFPLASMLVVSIILSLVMALLRKFL